MAISVLIADDDTLVRAGLRMMIETQPDLVVVGEVSSGTEAIALVAETDPDVVLMDIRMPGVDGIEATRRITRGAATDDGRRPRVVILTTFDLDEYVYDAVRAGASGFLLKRTPPEILLEGIRTIAAGDSLLSPSVTQRLMREFTRVTRNGPRTIDAEDATLDRLTDREREVLQLVACGLTNGEIADRLYLGESTVKTHLKHILTKLDLRDRIHAVIYAYEAGLVTPHEV